VGNDAAGVVRLRDDEPRITRNADGTFQVRMTRTERSLLRSLPAQLRDILEAGGPAVERLFPPAYTDDPEREGEYRRMVHDELVAGRRRALDVMEATVDAGRLDAEQMEAWLGALNDLRLVLGTRLDVTEDQAEEDLRSGDPRDEALALYHYLGWLEAQAVDALAAGQPGT
jgi:Domain of unknown function (DUF2017)